MFDEKWLQQVLADGAVTLDQPPDRPPVEKGKSPAPTTVKWTQPEIDFAKTVLGPMADQGELVFWTDQVQMNLVGQTYTPDFVALSVTGELLIYEVKGVYTLGSQDRSSVKLKLLRAQLPAAANVRVFWAKQRKDKSFRIREVINTRRKHPILRAG